MYIVEVIPITRRHGVETLTYFSLHNFAIGSIVKIEIRSKEVQALVYKIQNATNMKSLLRAQTYTTKQIKNSSSKKILSRDFMNALIYTSKYFATDVSKLLFALVPSALLKEDSIEVEVIKKTHEGHFEIEALQSSQLNRFHTYKTLIRSSFAKNESIFLLAPTIASAKRFAEYYARGIEKRVFLLHSGLTPKQQVSIFKQAQSAPQAIAIIATKGFLCIPRQDIGIYIVEQEASSAYKNMIHPYYDMRVLVKRLAQESNAKILLADSLLSMQTHKNISENKAYIIEEMQKRAHTATKMSLINMSGYTKLAKKNHEPYPIFSDEIISELEELEKGISKKHIFLLNARRGVAPQTVCRDCGLTVQCAKCNKPTTLHTVHNKPLFICHTCGQSESANISCGHCGSWNLFPLGIGIESVRKFIEKNYPNISLFQIDADSTKTQKQRQDAYKNFKEIGTGGILLGTEMALQYIDSSINISAIISLDALLTAPDFTVEERIYRMILILQEQTSDVIFIQTRTPENEMIQFAMSGSIEQYIHSELEIREQLLYPPYTTFIKISVVGTKKQATKDMQDLLPHIEKYKPRIFSHFIKIATNKYSLSALIRWRVTWPDEDFSNFLKNLPPNHIIKINPTNTT